jgi:ABC-type nitrate/sulfonate/bicarbonate transport system permease component
MRGIRAPLLVMLSLALLWQVLHQLAGDTAITAPAPTLAHLWTMVGQARFLPHLRETGLALAQALLIACAGGVGSVCCWAGTGCPGRWLNPCWSGCTPSPRSRCIRSSCCCSAWVCRPRSPSAPCTASFQSFCSR